MEEPPTKVQFTKPPFCQFLIFWVTFVTNILTLVSVCLSVCLPVCPSACLSVRPSVCPSVWPSVRPEECEEDSLDRDMSQVGQHAFSRMEGDVDKQRRLILQGNLSDAALQKQHQRK